MAAAEHQRAGPVERIEQAQPVFRPEARGQRQADQQHGEQGEEQQRAAVANGDRQPLVAFPGFRFQQGEAGQAGTGDHRDLGPGRGPGQHARAGQRHQRQARAIRTQAAAHAPDRLGHHRHRGDLQAMQHALGQQRAPASQTESEEYQQQRRGQGETEPGGEGAGVAGAGQAEGHANLAAGGAGEELAEGDQVGVAAFAQPAAAADELVAEIAEVGDGPAEGAAAQLEKGEEHREGSVGMAAGGWHANSGWRLLRA